MKNKGFTLIELLAVIIILGILMLIAIPSVTNYINSSRKSTYINTVNQLVKATTAKVNSKEIKIVDKDTTYYVPCTCVSLENGEAKSPYGKFDPAYVVVTYDGSSYHYYFTGKDVQNMGVPSITQADLLSKESIVGNVETIDTSVGIEGTSKVSIFSEDCSSILETHPNGSTVGGNETVSETTPVVTCRRADPSTLHTDTCASQYANCATNGWTATGSHRTTTITWGNKTTTSGVLKAGDPFDCDVNNDGIFNPVNERFYYVSPFYNSMTSSFDTDKAVFVYYSNVWNDGYGGLSIESQTTVQWAKTSEYNNLGTLCKSRWDDEPGGYWSYQGCSHMGPITVVKYLPSSAQWSNPRLIPPGERLLVNPDGSLFGLTYDPPYPYPNDPTGLKKFKYPNTRARLLTLQEVNYSCVAGTYKEWELRTCEFLYEKVGSYYTNSGAGGYWFENPAGYGNMAWITYTSYGRCDYGFVGSDTFAVRPAITVLLTNVEY